MLFLSLLAELVYHIYCIFQMTQCDLLSISREQVFRFLVPFLVNATPGST